MNRAVSTLEKVGAWAFIIGAILAVIIGLIAGANNGVVDVTLTSILIVLGLIVGFLNVTSSEAKSFLLNAVALVIVAALGGNVLSTVSAIGPFLGGILTAILTFVVPAAIIVALKAIYVLAAEE